MRSARNDIIPPSEVAARLQRSVPTLERWRRLNAGPPYLRIRGRIMYRAVDVDAWLENQRHPTAEAA